MINIRKLKKEFSEKYPNSELTAVILKEPDEIAPQEFFGKVATWLNVINTEKKG
jgi:hypothetical protein